MNISCKRESMLATFQTVATVVPARSPKPVLQDVKIEVQPEQSVLLATDLEQGIRMDVDDIEVKSPGAAILPVARFGSILRESDDETLQIESDGQGTIVRGQRSEFKLPAADPNEFPAISKFAKEDYYETSARLFRQMIHRTVFSIDTQSGRYALGGVLLEAADSSLIMVGTDGRRLAKIAGPASMFGQPQWDETIIIPGRTVNLLERALAEDDAEIKIAAQANEILVRSPRATIYTRLLEGRYPRWRDVFPERSGVVSLELPVGPLLTAVRQAAIVTNEDSRGVDFCFGDGKLVLAGRTAEVGQARVELPIAYQGEKITVMLDPRFFVDFLKVLASEETFQLEIQNAESAAVCRAQGDYDYVIMPLSRGQRTS